MRTLDDKRRLAQDALELAFELSPDLQLNSVMDCWAIIPVKSLGARQVAARRRCWVPSSAPRSTGACSAAC